MLDGPLVMHASSALRSLLLLGTLALACTTPACVVSQDDEDVGDDSSDALSAAQNEFDAEVSELESLVKQCEADGKCATRLSAGEGEIAPQTTRLGQRLCNTLRPLSGLESPLVFVGASAEASVLKTVADGGADLVFDLGKRQFAAFRYHTHGVQNLVGAEVDVYYGYAFARNKRNVVDAWSGDFQSAEAAVDTPFLKLSVGGSIFRAPDNTVWGALVSASVGVNALGPLGSVEVGVAEGNWTAWDAATDRMGRSWFLTSYTPQRTSYEGHAHTYLQFARARHQGVAMVQTLGPLGLVPAAQSLAIEAMQKRGLTFARACGR